jgi:CAAX protease family protein
LNATPRTTREIREQYAPGRRRASEYFMFWFIFALAAGLAAAAAIAPLAAALISAVGLRIPFPRIFDRTVIVTLAAAMLWLARPLGLAALIRDGFAEPQENWRSALFGFALVAVAIGALFAAAFVIRGAAPIGQIGARAAPYVVAAVTIALLEEGFFRAFILGGMLRDMGRAAALAASSAIFALTHLVRSPARFYLAGFHPMAGLTNLAASAARMVHPGDALPMLAGLFLLGLMLGAAFLRTGRIWFPAGMHAGLVIGAKVWPVIARGDPPLPRWLAGPGPVPIIAAPAGWILAIAILLLLPWLAGKRGGDPARGALPRPQL